MYILNFLPKFCLAREATLEMLKMASSEEKNAMPAAIHCHWKCCSLPGGLRSSHGQVRFQRNQAGWLDGRHIEDSDEDSEMIMIYIYIYMD